MRRPVALVVPVLLALAPVALATGIMGSDTPTRIPVPAAIFKARVTDLSGTVVELTRVTLDGEIVVGGKLGLADAAIPFEKVAVVRVQPVDDPHKRLLWAKLHDGTDVKVIVDDRLALTGEAVFGNYRIEARDLAKVEILP